MSGDGVVSVRVPKSLLETFRMAVDAAEYTVHDAAEATIDCLDSITDEDLRALPEPPREAETPRISFYVGLEYVDALAAVAQGSGLTVSSIFRRVIFGVLVCRTLEVVQTKSGWKFKLHLSNSKKTSIQNSQNKECHELS